MFLSIAAIMLIGFIQVPPFSQFSMALIIHLLILKSGSPLCAAFPLLKAATGLREWVTEMTTDEMNK